MEGAAAAPCAAQTLCCDTGKTPAAVGSKVGSLSCCGCSAVTWELGMMVELWIHQEGAGRWLKATLLLGLRVLHPSSALLS